MINKLDLTSNIEKYHLGGVIETVKWEISNGKLVIPFISPSQDLVGLLEASIDIEDNIVGVFNTSALLKMINILEDEMKISIEIQNKKPMKLLIEDSRFSLQYSLADPSVISNIPTVNEPEYDIEFNIDEEFISKFIKGKGALGSTSEIFRITNDLDTETITFVLGEPASHSNKISFSVNGSSKNKISKGLPFNSAYVKEILNANKNKIKEAKGFLNTEGLLKFQFITESETLVYYLPQLQV